MRHILAERPKMQASLAIFSVSLNSADIFLFILQHLFFIFRYLRILEMTKPAIYGMAVCASHSWERGQLASCFSLLEDAAPAEPPKDVVPSLLKSPG